MSKSNHNRIRLTLSTLLMGAFLVTALAFPHKASIGGEYVEAEDSLVRAKVEEWQGLKFGLMMHWGTYSQWEL